MKPPAKLLEALALPDIKELEKMGVEVGKLYTNHGLPIDMALDRLRLTKLQKIAILYGAQQWLIEHRRNSNATDKALDRQRKANREVLVRFIQTGEAGVY